MLVAAATILGKVSIKLIQISMISRFQDHQFDGYHLNHQPHPQKTPSKDPNMGYRHVVAVMILVTTTMAYFGRMNLSTAIVAMVKHPPKNGNSSSTTTTSAPDSSDNNHLAQQFDWNEKQQGVILGAFFYGYFVLQILVSRLAEILGPRNLCTLGLLATGVINLVTPWLAQYYGWFLTSRILMGCFQAAIFPCAFALAAKWIPDHERSTVTSMIYIGGNLGSIVASSVAGYLCKHGFAGGWPSVFYVTGIIALVVSILYYLLIRDDPEGHPLVSLHERHYIQSNIDRSGTVVARRSGDDNKPPVPWLRMFTSPAVWAGSFAQFTMMWALTVMMLKLPDYMHHAMQIPLERTGYFSSAAYGSESLTLFFGGVLADYMIKQRKWSKTTIRKGFQTIASIGSGIGLFFIPQFTSTDVEAFLAVLILSMVTIGLQSGGIIPLPADLSNEFAATVFGIFNMIAQINGFVCPYAIGWILDAKPDDPHGQWAIVWYITAALRIAGGIIFIWFGSAERQDWDKTTT